MDRIERLLRAQADTATAISRLLLTLFGLGVAGVLALQFPDSFLLTTATTVNIPLAGPASFKMVLILLPLILIGVRIYLEILLAHWRRLHRLTGRYRLRQPPVVSPLSNPVLAGGAAVLLYGLIPALLAALTWKAMVFPTWGVALLCLTVLATALLAGRAVWGIWSHAVVAAALAVELLILGWDAGWFADFRRPFQLQIANLERATLAGLDLQQADLRRANLKLADLSGARLEGANLTRADLRSADLSGADLRDARFDLADLTDANLRAVRADGASFFRTDLTRAALLPPHVWLKGAVFRAAVIDGLILPEEWSRDDFLALIEQWGAVVCHPSAAGRVAFKGRCIAHWPQNWHFYELVDEAVTFAEAREIASRKVLWGPLSSLARGKSGLLAGETCLQGYLWTVGSAEEHDFVLDRFWRPETGGLWLGASDAGHEGEWRWIGGPEGGVTFWAGGPKGKGGRAVAGRFENWHPGEPNNNGNPEGHKEAEDQAATSPGIWNDVLSTSRFRPVIEYGEIECPFLHP